MGWGWSQAGVGDTDVGDTDREGDLGGGPSGRLGGREHTGVGNRGPQCPIGVRGTISAGWAGSPGALALTCREG